MEKLKFRHAPPRATAMMEALRGLGYSTAGALADIIDNSIAAGARAVDLTFDWNGKKSRILIEDDGRGMTADELDSAMRLGDRNPLDRRAENDLGRFGLGLKTASFSQCRRLTVATVGPGDLQCLRWDLDVLAASKDNDWQLLEGPGDSAAELVADFGARRPNGTLVVWEVLDRIVTDGYRDQDFLELIERVERHLAMVFHRWLEGSRPQLRLRIAEKPIAPWDPFLTGHPAKPWHSPAASFPAMPGVEVECHVLPHKDRLSEKEEESARGPEGWTAQQGFYVYRNKRLLVAGGWLGLGQKRGWTQDEAHRLARIRLDIPNSADAAWKIDIRKSIARPPVEIRGWLAKLADETRTRARRTFASRGQVSRTRSGEEVSQVWHSRQSPSGMRYRIDTEHPAVRAVLDDARELAPQVLAMLRVIEETVPVQRIWIDTAEHRETPRTGFAGEPPAAVMEVLTVMYRNMVRFKGMSPELARKRLLLTEPFQNHPELVASLPDDPTELEKKQ
jgi:hypothetical protein